MNLVNLKELITYHPYHITTFADFADVETDLLEAALTGEEELTREEIWGIARYTHVPLMVLMLEYPVYLYRKRYRHCCMMKELREKLIKIWKAQQEGSRTADIYMNNGRFRLVNMFLDFQNNGKVTYCRYLGILAEVERTLEFIEGENRKSKRRGRGGRA